tara:strand:+ start:6782 stop:7189 length:408 start_codon:yes stop_codon:yes gene_type:complete
MPKKKSVKTTPKIEVFSDIAGRTLIGDRQPDEDGRVVYKNPAIVDAAVPQPGQIQVSAFPLIFAEFLEKPDEGSTWRFPKDTIVIVDEAPNTKLIDIYTKVTSPAPLVQPASPGGIVAPDGSPAGSTKTVKLFDE